MLPIIDVRTHTSAFARGEAYGAQARPQVARSIATYKLVFAGNGIGWEEAGRRARRYVEAIAAVDPALVEELEGIARGAEVGVEEILALNCRSEILPTTFLDIFADLSECTSLVVAPEGSTDRHTRLVQNWDWVGLQREALVLLRTVSSDGVPIDTLTEAGMVAKIGMNGHGLAVGLNMLRSRTDGREPGLPVHVLLRHSLSRATVAEVRELFSELEQGVGFASASNMPCADATGDVGHFEFSPSGWSELRPTEGIAVHTNHFLCGPLTGLQAPIECRASTDNRLDCARAYAARGPLSVADLQALLRDESRGDLSICRHPDPTLPPEGRVESVIGVILDCTRRDWLLAYGIPSASDFARLPLG